MEKHNPRLKAVILDVVNNQLATNDPPEAKETLKRLVSQGISEADAKIYIGQAVTIEIFETMKNHKPFDIERYRKNLARLPEPPREG